MRLSLGLAVGTDRVRAITLKRGRLVWTGEAAITDSIQAAIREVFETARLRRWPRPRMTVALGPTLAHVRRITGLPSISDAGLLARVVAQSPARFFLSVSANPFSAPPDLSASTSARNGHPLETTGVRIEQEGVGWCAALDAEVVREIERACGAVGLRVARFVPSVVCVAHTLGTGRLRWVDGEVHAEIETVDGVLQHCVRYHANGTTPGPTPEVPALGDKARFADACGAAMLPDSEPLAWTPGRVASDSAVSARRLAFGGVATTVGLVAAMVAPSIAAWRTERAAEARLEAIAGEWRRAEAIGRELANVGEALREAADFAVGNVPAIDLLAELTQLLPDGCALVSLRLDGGGGSLVGLAPRAACLMEALDRSAIIVAPEITGPVIRELVADYDVERVNVRFRLAPVLEPGEPTP